MAAGFDSLLYPVCEVLPVVRGSMIARRAQMGCSGRDDGPDLLHLVCAPVTGKKMPRDFAALFLRELAPDMFIQKRSDARVSHQKPSTLRNPSFVLIFFNPRCRCVLTVPSEQPRIAPTSRVDMPFMCRSITTARWRVGSW